MKRLISIIFIFFIITSQGQANKAEAYCKKAIKQMRQAGIKVQVDQCIYIK